MLISHFQLPLHMSLRPQHSHHLLRWLQRPILSGAIMLGLYILWLPLG